MTIQVETQRCANCAALMCPAAELRSSYRSLLGSPLSHFVRLTVIDRRRLENVHQTSLSWSHEYRVLKQGHAVDSRRCFDSHPTRLVPSNGAVNDPRENLMTLQVITTPQRFHFQGLPTSLRAPRKPFR